MHARHSILVLVQIIDKKNSRRKIFRDCFFLILNSYRLNLPRFSRLRILSVIYPEYPLAQARNLQTSY